MQIVHARSLFATASVLAALAAVLWLPASSGASGCTITWVGDIDGNWHTSEPGPNTNWSDNTLPDGADHVCLNNTGGPYDVLLNSSVTVSHFSIESGATLMIGAGQTLAAGADSSNAGTIQMQGSSTFRITNGQAANAETLTNTGTFAVEGGGTHVIRGDLANQGVFTVATASTNVRFEEGTFDGSRRGKLTNSGTLTVQNGGALFVPGANTLELAAGGVVNGPGAVNVDGANSLLRVTGGTMGANADVNLTGGIQNISPGGGIEFAGVGAGSATGKVDAAGGSGGTHLVTGTAPSGYAIDVKAGSVLGSGVDWTNAGTINVIGANASLRTENGQAANVETLTNTGTITVSGAGTQTIAGDLLNQGTLLVSSADLQFKTFGDNRPPKLTNSGTLTSLSGGVLKVQGGSTLELAAGGVVNGPGAVNVDGANSLLRVTGGTMGANADVNLTGGIQNISPGGGIAFVGAGAASGKVDAAGGSGGTHLVTGTAPSGYAIDVKAGSVLGSGVDWTNAGTINVIGANASLRTENGQGANVETLTNTGTITVSGAGTQTIAGDLLNQGTLSVSSADAQFRTFGDNRPPKLTNSGTLTSLSGGVLKVQSGSTLELAAGGVVNGPGAVNVDGANSLLRVTGGTMGANSDVNLTGGVQNVSPGGGVAFVGAASAGGQIDAAGGSGGTHPISGSLPSGFSLSIAASSVVGTGTDWTNAGTIKLIGANASLRTENGQAANAETLTNTGTIISSGAGTEVIAGDLLNQGTLSVGNTDLRIQVASDGRNPKLTNVGSGAISVAPSSQLTVNAGQPLELQGGLLSGSGTVAANVQNTGGEVRPGGVEANVLTVTGPYTQTGGGTLAIDVIKTGVAPHTSDRLAVSGAASLAGTLDIDTDGGKPPLGTRFQVLTAATRTGTFGTVTGLSTGPYEVEYLAGPAHVELLTVPVKDGPKLSIGDAKVIEGNAGTAMLVFPVTIAPAPSPPEQVEVDYETSNDTATAGSDYTAKAGTLTFAPGDLSEQIQVPVSGDTTAEPDETLLVRLRNPVGATLSDSRATGTIVGDDISIDGLTPDHGGDSGLTTVVVDGAGFGPTSTLEISRGGDEIAGSEPVVNQQGTRLSATFDLSEAELGDWDVTATGTGGTTGTLADAFTVEPARRGRIVGSATIPTALRYGFIGHFVVTLRNTGNTNANISLVRIVGNDVELRRRGGNAFVAESLDIAPDAPGDSQGPPIGVLPPDAERTLTIEFRSTTLAPHASLRLRAEVFTREGLESVLRRSVAPGSEEATAFPDPAGRIDGVVQDAAGQPIAGVPVTGEPSNGVDRVVITGEQGTFAFKGLADGEYEVTLGGGLGAATDRRVVEIGPADRSVELRFQSQLSELSGVVRAADGSRLGGATVHLRQGGELIDVADADGGGAFRFLVRQSGTYDLVAHHESLGIARLNGVAVTAGNPVGGLRILASTGQLTVNTSPGAGVSARPADLPLEQSPHGTAGGGGQAQFTALAPGAYEVQTKLAGKAPRRDQVTVTAAGTTLNAPLAPGGKAAGTVTGDGASPIPGAVVWAIDAASGTTASDLTDAGGNYLIDTLTPGPVDLWFTAPGYVPERVSGALATAGVPVDVDASLSRDGRDVDFTVVAGAPPQALIGALITVFDPSGRVPLAHDLSISGGIAHLGPLAPGAYRVEATAPGISPLRRDLVVAPEPSTLSAGTSKMSAGTSKTGLSDEELLALPPNRSLHFPTHDTFEALALEGKLQRDFYSQIDPPKRVGPDEDPKWRPSYTEVQYDQPCPNANKLYSNLLDSSFDVQRSFAGWQLSYQALNQLNTANVDGYFTQSAELAVKIWTLGRSLKFMSKKFTPPNNLDGGVELVIAGAADLGTNLIQNYRSGEGVGVNSEQAVNSTLGQIAALVDQQLDIAGKTPAAGPLMGIRDLVLSILKLQKDLDETYDRDFLSVVRGYEAAEKNYHRAIVKHHHLMRLFKEEAAKCPKPDDNPVPDEPTHPKPDVAPEGTSDNVAPNDPNDIDGPQGVGPDRWISPEGSLGYAIRFENVGPGTVNPPGPPASAPAVRVTVEQTLDPAVDLDSFELGSLGWGDIEVDIPGGLQSFHGEVPLEDGSIVFVDAALDRGAREVTWTLETINPETGELEGDPDAGFLPPEPIDDPGAGQGRVTYTARLLDSVAHAATVPAQAGIVFDFNPAIETPTWTNKVDRQPPQSAVTAVDQPGNAQGGDGCEQELDVSWSGSDGGSGLDGFAILVSQNGAPYEPWLAGTTATGGTLLTVPGSMYEFASVARDEVGNEEALPAEPDAAVRTVRCDDAAPEISAAFDPSGDAWKRTDTVVNLVGVDAFGGTGVGGITYGLSGAQGGGATVDDNLASFSVGAEGVTTVTFSAEDLAGNVSAPRTREVRIDRTAPVVSVHAPAAGAIVRQGAAASAAYSCSDALSGVRSCEGTIAPGGALPTDTPGQKSFTVTATDVAGNETTVTRAYSVAAAVDFGPKLLITVSVGKIKKAKTVPVRVRNGYAFPITGRLRLLGSPISGKKRRPLTAWRQISVGAAATSSFAMKISGKPRRALAAGKKLRVRAVLEVRNSANQAGTLNRNLVLKAKK